MLSLMFKPIASHAYFAFIVAWSTIALGRAPFELAFFNPKIVVTRILVGIPFPIIAGYLTKVVSGLIS